MAHPPQLSQGVNSELSGSGTTRTPPCALMACWHCRWRLSLLQHSAGPPFFFKPAFSPLAFHLTRPRAASHIFRKLLQSHTYSLILLSLRSLIFFFFFFCTLIINCWTKAREKGSCLVEDISTGDIHNELSYFLLGLL